MAQEGFDDLLALTDSRYRLSIIVARRAAQLKMGLPPLLSKEETPKTRNTVSLAMKEFELGKSIRFSSNKKDLPTPEEVRKMIEKERREAKEKATSNYTISVKK